MSEELSQKELNDLFSQAYTASLNNESPNEIKGVQLTENQAAGVANESPPAEEAPTEVVENVAQEQQETTEEQSEGGDPKQPVQEEQEEENDELSWVKDLDEEKRSKFEAFQQKLKEQAEQERKKLENERRAAVGRAAFFQKQVAQIQKAPKTETAQPKFVPPQTPELDALIEADPAAAKAFQAHTEAIAKQLQEQYNAQLTPLRQAYEAQQAQEEWHRQEQARMLYEAHPDVEQVIESDPYKFWLDGMDKQHPGFKQYVQGISHTRGSQDNPGAADILDLFHKHYSEWEQGQKQATATPPEAQAKASAVLEQRKNKLDQAPPSKTKPAAVTPGKPQEDLQKVFQDTFKAESARLGWI